MPSILVTALSWASLSIAATLPRQVHVSRNVSGTGFVQLPMTRVEKQGGPVSRRQEYDAPLFNPDFGNDYFVHLDIGTPPQPVYLSLDTGSSETWCDPTCSTASTTKQVAQCNSYPRYDPYNSNTAIDQDYPFYLSYGKGSASGEYLTDDFLVGGASIQNLQFGWAGSSEYMTTGIIAVGFGEAIAGYPCLIDQMALQGIIHSRAFSLDLGGVDTQSGSVLFGGIDTKKFTGALSKRVIIDPNNAPDGFLRYWVYMTSVGITKPGSSSSVLYTVPPPAYQQPVVLDSGSTLSTLPSNLVTAMLADFTGVQEVGTTGLYAIDCSQTTLSGTLDFGFGNTIINVPYHQFIYQSGGSCFFGAVSADPATHNTWILGDTVLRAAYAVFDQDNGNIWIANYVDCGTNILPIGSGVNAVPSVTGACTPTITPQTSTSSSTSSRKSSSSSSSSTKPTTTTSSSLKSTSTTSSSTSKSTSTSSSSKKTSSTTSTTSKSTSTSTKSTTTSTSSSIKTTSTSKSSTSKSTSTTSTSKTSTKISTSTSKTSTSSSLKTTTTTSSSSTAKPTEGYVYVGCFKDSSPHSLTKILANNSMTVEICLDVAHAANPPYPYAGVEYGRECWAALTSPAAATPTSGAGACTMTCTGNPTEACGGKGMFNLYASATASA